MSLFYSKYKRKKKEKDIVEFNCNFCPRNNLNINSPKMLPSGSNTPLLYFLGESPGFSEDEEGRQFVGDSGNVLRESLYKVIDEEDVDIYIRWNNMLRCCNDNITPNPLEIECCKSELIKDIENTKPWIVVGFGNIPLKAFTNGNKITLWRGRFIPIKVGNHECWYFPMFHPSYLLRNRRKGYKNELDDVFDRDMKKLFDFLLESSKPEIISEGYSSDIEYVMGESVEDFYKIRKWLEVLKDEEYLSIDIETNQLRPYYEDARIITIAISNNKKTYVFPVDHKDTWLFDPTIKKDLQVELLNFLLHSGHKICHNLKFELEYFLHYFRGNQNFMRKTDWDDTMIQAYLLDHRTSKQEGMLNLDRLIFLNFGFNLKELSPLDKSNLENEPLDKVLVYNGMDAKYTHKLFFSQKKRLDNVLEKCYNTLVNTSKTLAVTQSKGVWVNEKVLKKLTNEYTEELKSLMIKIKNVKEVKQYEKLHKAEINPLSPIQLVVIFRDMMKLPKLAETLKLKRFAVTDEVLMQYEKDGVELAGLIMKYREYTKLKSTYADNVSASLIDGRLFTQFFLGGTATGRLSSGSSTND